MLCPKCKSEIPDNSKECLNCGLDIALYNETYQRLYQRKLNELECDEQQIYNHTLNGTAYSSNAVHRPRCPYCNSDSLTRITSMDKVVNIAMFGLLGNKRKYQWHCNHCNTNF